MTEVTETSYRAAAQAYAAGVLALVNGPVSPTAGADRGESGPVEPEYLARQAEALAPAAEELTRAAAAQLEDDDPQTRQAASTRLLAKALTDLEISALLLQAAQDEEDGITPGLGGVERSGADALSVAQNLNILLGEVSPAVGLTERGLDIPLDLPSARGQLTTAVEDTLDLIQRRAAKTGQSAIGGLAGMGLSQVASAAGIVGLNIAQAAGIADKVTRLYNVFHQFVVQSYESIVALLGPVLSKMAADHVVKWLDGYIKGEKFEGLIGELYETGQLQSELCELAKNSQAGLEKYIAALVAMNELTGEYQKQTDLLDKLIKGMGLLGGAAAAALPHGRLILTAAYVVATGYAIFSGADFLDARRLQIIDRVPGAQKILTTNLAA